VLVSLVAYAGFCALAMGQASVFFVNRIGGQFQPVDAPFFDDQGIPLAGTNYVAQLYAWKTGTGFVPQGPTVPFGTNGYFFYPRVVVDFISGCLPAWVQVRAWSTQGGPSLEQAALAGAWTGVSEVLFIPQMGSPARPEACIDAHLFGLTYPGTPIVVQQPQNETVLVGQTATLSVIASSGVTMFYQWFKQPSDRPDGLIDGATNATYTSPALTRDTTFWVSITNSAGSVLSDKAAATVVSALPLLSVQMAACVPTLTLDGPTGLTYRLEYSTNLSATNWTSVAEFSLSTTQFTFGDWTWSNSPARFYRVVVP